VTAAGSGGAPWVLTRAVDADEGTEFKAGSAVFVTEGTANADSGYVLTTDGTVTIDTTSLTFALFSSTTSSAPVAGDGISVSGSTVTVRADTTSSVQSIVVNSGASPNGVAVKFDSAGAIDATSAGTRVKVGANGGIFITSNALEVKLDSNPGLQKLSTGLSVLLDSNPGLVLGAGGLKVKTYSGGAITTSASGIEAVVDGSTLEISSNALRQKDAGTTWAKLATALTPRLGNDRREDFVATASQTTFELSSNSSNLDAASTFGYVGHEVFAGGVMMRYGATNDYTIDFSGTAGAARVIFNTGRTVNTVVSVLYKRTGSAQ
jgi:hypothetical protein